MIKPCIPDDWPSFVVRGALPDGTARYRITVENPAGNAKRIISAELDGLRVAIIDGASRIPLSRDGGLHEVRVMLGA